jgi:hypothetical protein
MIRASPSLCLCCAANSVTREAVICMEVGVAQAGRGKEEPASFPCNFPSIFLLRSFLTSWLLLLLAVTMFTVSMLGAALLSVLICQPTTLKMAAIINATEPRDSSIGFNTDLNITITLNVTAITIATLVFLVARHIIPFLKHLWDTAGTP